MRRANPAWNRMGPPVPCWFRRKLREISPNLTLQFIPPMSDGTNWRGVNPVIYPNGVWDVCNKLKKTGYLHPVAVWSLADSNGNFAPPGMDTVKLLRTALRVCRKGQVAKLERAMDASILEINKARQAKAETRLHNALQRYSGRFMDRQWQNRVYMRREVPESEVLS